MRSKQKKLAQNVIALIILIILTSVLYLLLNQNVPVNSRQKTLDTVFTKVKIENGSVAMSLDVTLDFSSSDKYTLSELQSITEHALRDLDYDKMQDEEVMDYLKTTIQNCVHDTYPDLDEEINVYITDFRTGYSAELYEVEKNNSGNDKIYKGLFKGIK